MSDPYSFKKCISVKIINNTYRFYVVAKMRKSKEWERATVVQIRK